MNRSLEIDPDTCNIEFVWCLISLTAEMNGIDF